MDITQFHANGIFLLLIVLSYTIISLCINTLLQYVYYIDSCHCLIHLSLLANWLVLLFCAFTHYSYRIPYPHITLCSHMICVFAYDSMPEYLHCTIVSCNYYTIVLIYVAAGVLCICCWFHSFEQALLSLLNNHIIMYKFVALWRNPIARY